MALAVDATRCNWILEIKGLSDDAKELLYKQCLLDTKDDPEKFNWGGDDGKDLNIDTFNDNDFFLPVSNPKFNPTPSQKNRKFTADELYKRYLMKAISYLNLFTQYYIPKNFSNWEVLPSYHKRMTQKILFSIIDFWSVNINPLELNSNVSYNNPYGYSIETNNTPQTDWTTIIGTEATHMIISTGWAKQLFFLNKKKKEVGNLPDVWLIINYLIKREKELTKLVKELTSLEGDDLKNIKWLTENSITNIIGNYGSLIKIGEVVKKPPEPEIVITKADDYIQKFKKGLKLLERKKINYTDYKTYQNLAKLIAKELDRFISDKFDIETNFINTVNCYPHLRNVDVPMTNSKFVGLQLYAEDESDTQQENAIAGATFQYFGFDKQETEPNYELNSEPQGREFKVDTSDFDKYYGNIERETRIGWEFPEDDFGDTTESFRVFGNSITFKNYTIDLTSFKKSPYFVTDITIKDTYNDFFEGIKYSTEAIKWLYNNRGKTDNLQVLTDPQLYLSGNDAKDKLQKLYDKVLNSNIGTTVLISCLIAREDGSGETWDFCDCQFELSKAQNNNGRVIFTSKFVEDKDGQPPKTLNINFENIKKITRIFQQASILQGQINWDDVKVPENKSSIEMKAECKDCAD